MRLQTVLSCSLVVLGIERRKRLLLDSVVAVLIFAANVVAQEKVTFDDQLAAILRQRCSTCHSATTKKADLDVTSYLSLMQGGASGKVIEPGDPDASYLFALVTHEAEPYMPQNADKLPDAEIDLLRRWIEGGALENQSSKAPKSASKMVKAVEVAPGARPEVVPLPPRLVLEPHHWTSQAPMARSLATSPWAPLVAVAGQRQVLLYHTATLELVGVFPFPEGQPNVVRFSTDGSLLLAGGGRPAASGKVVVWEIATGERIIEIGDELDAVLAADISADHTLIALGGSQRLVRVYATDSGQLKYEINKHTDWVQDLRFSPDGVLLASADRNGGLHLWEARTGNEYLTLNGHTGAITSLSWRADSNLLASGSEDGTVRLWELENGTQVKNWNAQAAVQSLEFARDGRLVSCGRDQVARLWDQEAKQLWASKPLGEVAVSTTFCDESNRIVAGNWLGDVVVLKAEDAEILGRLSTNPPMLAERLRTAEQLLQEQTSAAGPLIDARTKADAAAASVQAGVVAAQGEADKLRKQVEELAAQASQLSDSRLASDTERGRKASSLEQIRAAMPLVSETLRHLTEASGKLPNDAQLTEIFNQLSERLRGMEAQANELQANIDELTAAIEAADANLKDANGRLEAARKDAAAAGERLAAANQQASAAATAAETARAAAQPVETQLAETQKQIERWQSEIAFRDRILALRAKLAEAQKLADEHKVQVDEANANLSEAQSNLTSAQAGLDESARSVDAISAELDEARAVK